MKAYEFSPGINHLHSHSFLFFLSALLSVCASIASKLDVLLSLLPRLLSRWLPEPILVACPQS
jgi:hypothetical protein